jgi:hypothetical protein
MHHHLELKEFTSLAIYVHHQFSRKNADDAEHHLPANALQPVTAAKSTSFFLFLACSMLT